MGSSVVGYDGNQNEGDEERLVERQQEPHERKSKHYEKSMHERVSEWLHFMRGLASGWRQFIHGNREQMLWAIRTAVVVAMTLLGILVLLWVTSILFGVKLMDLLKILAVPITVGAAVPLLNRLQKKRELDVENQRAQDTALEAYEEKMDRLILDRGLRTSERDSDVRGVARLHTLSVLRRLDPNRKRHVVQFLWEGNLIRSERQEIEEGLYQREPPIVSLREADLSYANLARMNLAHTDLSGAELVGADLRNASLSATTQSSASISLAMRAGVPFEDVEQPVAPSTLVAANLSGADLRGARLLDVHLLGANLSGADLTGARVTDRQLEMCDSLEGATMPNGQKYEDWLKSKGSGEDGKNSGPS